MSFRAIAVALALVACGGASGKPGVAQNASATPDADSKELRHVDLELALGNKPFPLPIVHGKVAGVPTLFLVDTGANAHILAGWVARKAQLTTRAFGDQGVDHAGRSIETRRATHPQVHIDNWGDLPDEPMLVTDVPDAVARLGIGGFISPQQLANDDASIVIDFQKSEMRQMRRGDSVDAAGNALTLDPPRVCLDKDSPLQGLAFVLHGQIEGNAVDLLLDTGANHSDLLSTSKPGKALLPRSEASHESVYAASGKVTPRTVHDAHLHVGALEVTRDVDLIPGKEDDFCPRDGVLAMDVLKQCVLVIDRQTVSGLCKSDVTK
jgi:predicted aspartyl protease